MEKFYIVSASSILLSIFLSLYFNFHNKLLYLALFFYSIILGFLLFLTIKEKFKIAVYVFMCLFLQFVISQSLYIFSRPDSLVVVKVFLNLFPTIFNLFYDFSEISIYCGLPAIFSHVLRFGFYVSFISAIVIIFNAIDRLKRS